MECLPRGEAICVCLSWWRTLGGVWSEYLARAWRGFKFWRRDAIWERRSGGCVWWGLTRREMLWGAHHWPVTPADGGLGADGVMGFGVGGGAIAGQRHRPAAGFGADGAMGFGEDRVIAVVELQGS